MGGFFLFTRRLTHSAFPSVNQERGGPREGHEAAFADRVHLLRLLGAGGHLCGPELDTSAPSGSSHVPDCSCSRGKPACSGGWGKPTASGFEQRRGKLSPAFLCKGLHSTLSSYQKVENQHQGFNPLN